MEVTNNAQFYQPVTTPTAKNVSHSDNGEAKNTEVYDRVTLSPEARKVMQDYEADKAAMTDNPEESLPLEMHAVPDWYTDYGYVVSGELGASANYFSEKYPGAAAATKDEREEYSMLVRKHYDQLMDKHEIEDTETHYQKLIVDENSSQALRHEMADMVRSDSRLMELMSIMGREIS